jgi:hypothetical protein
MACGADYIRPPNFAYYLANFYAPYPIYGETCEKKTFLEEDLESAVC